jgi:hypothetical protein
VGGCWCPSLRPPRDVSKATVQSRLIHTHTHSEVHRFPDEMMDEMNAINEAIIIIIIIKFMII